MLALYFVLSFVWNTFIVATFLRKRKLLREPANILLLNLAIADLMVAATQMLFSTLTTSAQEFIFGSSDVIRCGMCDFVGVFFMLLYGVSMHTLAALSFERFLLLYKPFNYKKIMSQQKVIALVVGIWGIAICLAVPPVIGFGQIEFNFGFGSCIPRFGGTNFDTGLNNFYYVAYIALESLFPIVTIAICSFWTYWFVNKFLKRNYRRRSFYNRHGPRQASDQRQEDNRYHRQQHQLVKVFGALLVCNAISWSPVLILVVTVGVVGADSVRREVYIFGWICYLTAPVFHPIIESFFVKDMRLVVCKGVGRVREAGSFIMRSTTSMIGMKEVERDIDLANQRADEDNYISQRRIQPFGRKRGVSTVSTATEVTELPTSGSRDNTPSPRVAQKAKEANIQLRREKTPDFSPKPLQRRITFSDEQPPQFEGTPTDQDLSILQNGHRKSVLKVTRNCNPNSLAPLSETADVPSTSPDSSPDLSVFESPSPLANGYARRLVAEEETTVSDDEPSPFRERQREEGREEEGEIDNEGGVTLVPLKDDSNSSCELTLHTTVCSERRGSLTLV